MPIVFSLINKCTMYSLLLTNHLHLYKSSIHSRQNLAHNKCHHQGNFHLLGMERQIPGIRMHNKRTPRCTNISCKEHLPYSEKVTTQKNNSRSQGKYATCEYSNISSMILSHSNGQTMSGTRWATKCCELVAACFHSFSHYYNFLAYYINNRATQCPCVWNHLCVEHV